MFRPDRLEKLAQVLDKVPAKNFNMGAWIRDKIEGSFTKKKILECGTRACALGWACTIREFRDDGLKMNYFMEPKFGDKYGEDAGAEFFGIPYKIANHIFMPVKRSSNNDPKVLAAEIRELIADPWAFAKRVN